MKQWILILLISCTTFFAHAQAKIGIKGGLNITGLTDQPPEDVLFPIPYGTRTAFNIGLLASIPVSSFLLLQPELNYSEQGNSASDPARDKKFIYDYLNVPVLFKIHDASGFFGETGPQIGFLLRSVEEKNGKIIPLDQIEPIDFSWVFGAGYELQTIPLGFDVRYNLGLTNTNKQPTKYNSKNSVFQVNVFYMFKL